MRSNLRPPAGSLKSRFRYESGELVLEFPTLAPGISQEQLPFIFDRFWQADTSAQRKIRVRYRTRTGRELVEIQGGQVTVTSELGKDTAIYDSACPITSSRQSPYDATETDQSNGPANRLTLSVPPETMAARHMAQKSRQAGRVLSLHDLPQSKPCDPW